MNAGKLRTRAEVLKPVYASDGSFGQDVKYSPDGKAWVELLKPGFASAVLQGDGEGVRVTQGMRIRTRTIENDWVMRINGKDYIVLHVENRIPGELILTTEACAHGNVDIV